MFTIPSFPSWFSSKQQDHASQMPDLERWVAAQGGAVAWFRDKFTGKSMARPGMDKLLADVLSWSNP